MITKAEIQLVRSLADKRNRDEHRLFVAEGEKLIEELRGSQLRVRRIYALDGVFEGDDVQVVTTKEMERLSMLKSANNSIALVELPHYKFNFNSLERNLILALDDVQNPGNLGTIIRLADWFGISDIVCSPSTADCFNPKVVQATMGAILRVRVHYLDLPSLLHSAKEQGVPIYGTFLDGKNIYDYDLQQHGIIVMGNEGRGISAECAEAITNRLFIPPYPADCSGSESLNVAIATAVTCAEFRRQAKK
jgi:TrmH family RNA methyltransferase